MKFNCLRKIYGKVIHSVFWQTLFGNYINITLDIDLPIRLYGKKTGEWAIARDYVRQNKVALSFGVGKDIDFDLGLINDFHLIVHAYDPTPNIKKWLGTQSISKNFHFHNVGVSDKRSKKKFYSNRNEKWYSYSEYRRGSKKSYLYVRFQPIWKIIQDFRLHEIEIIKLDIEGSEYVVLLQLIDLIKSGVIVHQILVEFHHRFPEFSPRNTNIILKEFKKLGYMLFFVSENKQNYCFISEKTLHRTVRGAS